MLHLLCVECVLRYCNDCTAQGKRGITEHAGYQPSADQRLCSRTVINPLETFLFAPHRVAYHIEHHVYPGVPFFNLPRVHAILKERESLPAANVYTSYRAVLRDLVTS